MKPLTIDVDLDAEARAMADHIRRTWAPLEGLDAIVLQVRDAALRAGRAWLNQYELGGVVHELEKARRTELEQSCPETCAAKLAPYYDAVGHFLSEMSFGTRRLHEAGRDVDGEWDYSRRARTVHARVLEAFPSLSTAKPLGWDEMAKNYNDFDGQEEYDGREDVDRFEGSRVEGGGGGHFVIRTALPYVMYDEKCQGRKAPYTLVGAIFAQFLGIQEFLNGERAKASLRAFIARQSSGMVFECEGTPDNPHLQVLWKAASPAPTQQDWERALEDQRRHAALTSEQLAASEVTRAKVVQRLLASLRSEQTDEEIAREKARDEEFLKLVREAFPA